MTFPFTEDHDMIREAARGFLQGVYDGGKGPEASTGYDAAAWQSFAAELGMAGIAIAEDFGGAGLGDLGRVVVMEELGASLVSIPFAPTCTIAADMITAMGSNAAKTEYLPKIASGKTIIGYADGRETVSLSGTKLSGKIQNMPYGAQADLLLLTVKTHAGDIVLIALPCGTSGITATPKETMDPTRSLSDIDLDNVAMVDSVILGERSAAQADAALKTSHIALAAECVGGAQQCLDMTLDYLGQRVQFGRPIASFQAIKHRCADMFILIEAARSAVYAAAIETDADKKVELAMIAKAYASDAFFEVAGHAIQLHGGIGFTWEYPLHYFFKRARANRALFGSSTHDYASLADTLLGEVA